MLHFYTNINSFFSLAKRCNPGCSVLVFVVLIVGSICIDEVHGQETQYSLFHTSPVYINPANTGNFVGDWRLGANYRNQWASIGDPFQTASISYDQHFFLMNQTVSAGLFLFSDYTGPKGLSFTKAYASLAYGYQIRENYLSAGLQVGYVFGSIGGDRTSPSQWDAATGYFNPNNSAGTPMDDRVQYMDVNLGIHWKRNISLFEPSVGVAFHHLNAPKISFYSSDEPLPMRMNVSVDAKTKLSDEYFVTPRILYSQQGNTSLSIIGIEAGTQLFGSRSAVKEIRGGVHFRNGISETIDAFSIVAGAHINRIDVSIAYDVNVSGLSNYSGNRGAFEFSIIYKSISTVLNSYSIPCDRL